VLAVLAVGLGLWLASSGRGDQARANSDNDMSGAPPAAAAPVAGPIVSARPASPLSVLLAELPNGTDAESAFGTLFRMWGVAYAPGPPGACQQAETTRLHCVYRQGTLQDIAALNTPVIMTLRDRQQVEYNVVLAGLSGDAAIIDIAGREYRVSAAELEQFWSGEYLLLWRPQTAAVKSFFPGMRDPDVRWLRESLAIIQGEPVAPMDSDLYDTELEARVRAYQRDRHLTANGLAGHETQAAIIADLPAADTPRLVRVN
jgi:general secretion pathway protein A